MEESSRVESEPVEKDCRGGKKAGAVSQFLFFLPRFILLALLGCTIMFLSNLAYCLLRHFLTGEILSFLPEANQVIYYARGGGGLLEVGIISAIALFAYILYAGRKRKSVFLDSKLFNNEQTGDAEGLALQNMPETTGSETPAQVVALPLKKGAPKKIYGKYCAQEETKTGGKFPPKNKPAQQYVKHHPGYKPGRRGKVILFKQKYPALRKEVHKPLAVTPGVNASAGRIKRGAQSQSSK